MKTRLSFFILLLLLPLIAEAQIRLAIPATAESNTPKCRYDSTKNFISNINDCIGQDFYVIPRTYKERYEIVAFYKSPKESIILNPKLNEALTYDEVQGQTFHAIGIEKLSTSRSSRLHEVLQLQSKETGATIYYDFRNVPLDYFPFIVLGYKDKFEKENKDICFVYKGFYLKDFNTGELLHSVRGTIWIFKEVVASPDEMKPCYYFVNDSGIETVTADIDDFILKSEIDSYIKQYGKKMVEAAIYGDVKKGMSRSLVRIARGNPKHINTSSYGEQWVYGEYGDDCIYFENGVVVAWN